VIYTPITQIDLNNKPWLWYDTAKIADLTRIDLLLIDGPPSNLQKHARYPAFPILEDRLNKQATIILDDYDRIEDKEIVELWMKEYTYLTREEFSTEKGTGILYKSLKEI
jgi:hypothetical protein